MSDQLHLDEKFFEADQIIKGVTTGNVWDKLVQISLNLAGASCF